MNFIATVNFPSWGFQCHLQGSIRVYVGPLFKKLSQRCMFCCLLISLLVETLALMQRLAVSYSFSYCWYSHPLIPMLSSGITIELVKRNSQNPIPSSGKLTSKLLSSCFYSDLFRSLLLTTGGRLFSIWGSQLPSSFGPFYEASFLLLGN